MNRSSVCQCVSVSVCQCVSVSVCQRVSVSMCQCVSASVRQCPRVSIRVSMCHACACVSEGMNPRVRVCVCVCVPLNQGLAPRRRRGCGDSIATGILHSKVNGENFTGQAGEAHVPLKQAVPAGLQRKEPLNRCDLRRDVCISKDAVTASKQFKVPPPATRMRCLLHKCTWAALLQCKGVSACLRNIGMQRSAVPYGVCVCVCFCVGLILAFSL